MKTDKVTAESIRTWKGRQEKIAALTAYDYPTARLVDEAGVDLILVGDSLGMMVLGHPDTTAVTLADMVHHTRAVRRGVRRGFLVADLPIGAYANPGQAVESAGQLAAAGAEAVKLEGGQSQGAQIRAITRAGIPVVGHIGMLPQHIREEGRYQVKGKNEGEREFLRREAAAVVAAGACAVVLELVEPASADEITRTAAIPTIGIGSGPKCDGQILVVHDLIGFYPWFTPRHVRPRADVAGDIRKAVTGWVLSLES
ncbi:MAG: 3-methyl-2-oxobutanoate hydroxymethyltransferase [Verrucomicrobia bacterium]|nr:3-methyl-2-oxobutanoate hydroxymethyltransferase [Verrucomicrobiota bacterium]